MERKPDDWFERNQISAQTVSSNVSQKSRTGGENWVGGMTIKRLKKLFSTTKFMVLINND